MHCSYDQQLFCQGHLLAPLSFSQEQLKNAANYLWISRPTLQLSSSSFSLVDQSFNSQTFFSVPPGENQAQDEDGSKS